ncbi:anti-sigma factor family protein [Streptosporangium sp. CA-135522]|uniref:anti-sigma factor family protein n=1 Tax=Streptosporangium sp. CA-135522 TaxID=3240072 RepID=UPI003D903254
MKRFSCDESVELVTAYLERELDQVTAGRFEEHLGGCEGCERYLGQFRTTVTALSELRPQRLPDDRRERLLSAFRDRRTS